MSAAGDLADERVARRRRRDRDDLGARHHHLSGREIGEAEDAVEHLLFVFLEDAGFLAGRHEHLELFFGVHHGVAALGCAARAARTTACPAPFSTVMNGQKALMKSSVGLTTTKRRRLRTLERDGLGRELAEHDVQGGDDGKGDRDGRCCAPWLAAIVAGRKPRSGLDESRRAPARQPTRGPRLAIVMPSCVAAM